MTRIANGMPPIGDLASIQARHNPDVIAFADDDSRLSWSEFETQSNRAGTALSDVISKGDRIACFCRTSVPHTVLWTGGIKAGAILTNLHIRAAPNTITYCMNKVNPHLLVIDTEFLPFVADRVWEKLNAPPRTVVPIGEVADAGDTVPPETTIVDADSFIDRGVDERPDTIVDTDDIAKIAWTSGTTGRPKGWCQTHETLTLKAAKIARTGRLRRLSRSLGTFSPSFSAWYNNVVPAMMTGSSLFTFGQWDPETWLERVESDGITHAALVPTMWREVLEQGPDEYDLGSLRQITFTGEKIDHTLLNQLREEICPNVLNAYASTEVLVSTMYHEEMEGDRIESVGKPVQGTDVRIVEPGGDPSEEVPHGTVGEILVKGPDMGVWIWGESQQTADAVTDGWWHSGDMGYRDDDGFLYLEGRSDFMILSKGVKVFPNPIEERLEAHAGVDRAIVTGVEDPEYGEKVTAIVSRSDDAVSEEDLDAWCRESDEIADYERPRAYHFSAFEERRTATGKFDRQQVLDDLAQEI